MPGRILAPSREENTQEIAESLRFSLGKLAEYQGGFPSHPFLGSLTREEWLQVHCIHSAHHLSFAIPTS